MDNKIQQQQLGSGLPKPAESSEALVDDGEDPIKDGRNSAGLGSSVQEGGAVGITPWKQELGGYWGDAQDPDGIPP